MLLEWAVDRLPVDKWLWNNLGWTYYNFGLFHEARIAYIHSYNLAYEMNNESKKIKLSLPFSGKWKVQSGNGTECILFNEYNHFGIASRFAWDFVKVNENNRTYYDDGASNNKYYSFGDTIRASADGIVVAFCSNKMDNAPNSIEKQYNRNALGNYVVIRHLDNVYSVYGHLMKSSVLVKKGNVIRCGQAIGLCGNSGRSNIPHLHFSLMNGSGSEAVSIPSRFYKYLIMDEGKKLIQENGIPRGGDLIEEAE